MNTDFLSERVLVVPSSLLYAKRIWNGLLLGDNDYYLELIAKNYTFEERRYVEHDPDFQQIIPYLVFFHNDSYFVIKKLKGSSEYRLHHRYMMGVGGHINEEDDGCDEGVLERALMREWREEVHYAGGLRKRLVGILNDNTSAVSQVHIGLVYLMEGDSPCIGSAEPDKMSGELIPTSALRNYYETMDSWGRTIIHWIERGKPCTPSIVE